MSADFDTVVVGSGFGASVVAYRLAEAGKDVCVLERGKKYPPGSFPRSPRDVARNLWDPRAGLFGMFDLWSFRGIESLVSSGLGGGSLIYANVLIRKPPETFINEYPDGRYEPWPIGYPELKWHYKDVEEMLGAKPYPFGFPPYSLTPKTIAMKEAAECLGLEWGLPKLAVTFGGPGELPGEPICDEPPNLHGSTRNTCRLCGECDVGCNYGSKNTLDYNYLSRAQDKGAKLCTLAEVRRIEPMAGGGYRITYVKHDPDDECERSRAAMPHKTITANRLVLGAGTFGSTYLLLRNRSAFPKLSPALGTHFSGNGDLLTFFRHARRRANGASVPRWLNAGYGPVITSAIAEDDFYIEDGGVPQFLNWLVEAGGAPSVILRGLTFAARRLAAHALGVPRSNVSADVSALFGGGVRSATWLPMLAMGRDVPDGVMRLKRGDLDLDWTMRSSSAYFAHVENMLHQIAEALGARVTKWPLRLFKRVITVHPLGGCPMAKDEKHGVVDHQGHVFGYPELYVVDGSVMPGPVGPNPSLTIAAFANRAANGMLGLPL
jgi:cholesterol oxidase